MIIHKRWKVNGGIENGYRKEGWFLFGVIPLYIRTTAVPV